MLLTRHGHYQLYDSQLSWHQSIEQSHLRVFSDTLESDCAWLFFLTSVPLWLLRLHQNIFLYETACDIQRYPGQQRHFKGASTVNRIIFVSEVAQYRKCSIYLYELRFPTHTDCVIEGNISFWKSLPFHHESNWQKPRWRFTWFFCFLSF